MKKRVIKTKKIKWRGGIILVAVLGISGFGIYSYQQIKQKESATVMEEDNSMWVSVNGLKGYSRVITKDEYEFFQYFVKRDLSKELNDTQLDRKVKEYIQEVNARFYLGSTWGLVEPYDFALLETRMKQENEQRKIKKDNNEPVYGLEAFDLRSYFQYIYSNLEVDLENYIIDHFDEKMLKDAENYYKNHRDEFKIKSKVSYSITSNGETKTYKADRQEMKNMQNTDTSLFDFLSNFDEKATYTDEVDGVQRDVVVTKIEYEKEGFEYNKKQVVRRYVEDELLKEMINKVATNNQMEFVK